MPQPLHQTEFSSHLICSFVLQSEIDDYMPNVLEYNTFYPMNALFEISWTAQSYLMHEAMSQLNAK